MRSGSKAEAWIDENTSEINRSRTYHDADRVIFLRKRTRSENASSDRNALNNSMEIVPRRIASLDRND
jgi:hypothetical protein